MKKIVKFCFGVLIGLGALNCMANKEIKILIVGGGPAGLTVAKSLENKGFKPVIVEKRKEYGIEGAGIAIPANGAWALEKIGISIKKSALHVKKMVFTDVQGSVLVDEDITNIHPEGTQFYAIDRTKLNEVLVGQLEHSDLRMGMSVKIIKDQGSSVDIVFSNGAHETFDCVIITDGMHSHMRALIDKNYSATFGDEQYGAEYLGIQMWRTIIDNTLGQDYPTYMLGQDTVFLTYPINDQKLYVYAHEVVERKGVNPSDQDHLEYVLKKFESYGGIVPKVLSQMKEEQARLLSHYLETTKGTIWHQGNRIIYAGDASRGFSPMLQNGAAQAFEDAYVLGELFATLALDDIAAAYETRRAARAQWVKTASDRKIVALGQEQVNARNAMIREKGAPNVSGFKILMQKNP